MATINGTAGDDVLTGTDAADSIYGLDGNDIIDGGLGADLLYGGGGDDLFKFTSVQYSSPAPTAIGLIDGGDGIDTVDWSSIWPVTFGAISNSRGDAVTGAYIGSQKFEIRNVEKFYLGQRDDNVGLLSSATGLEIHLGSGDDTVNTYGGNFIYGGSGNDEFFISGSFGYDRAVGIIDGGSGTDTLITNIAFSVDLAAGTATGGQSTFRVSNIETLEMTLSGYAAIGLGDDQANTMRVRTYGDDGRAGVTFDGRGGDDYISGGLGNDTLSGGAGIDTVSYEYANAAVRVDLASGLASGGAGRDTLTEFENVVGSAYDDTIVGDGGRNLLSGGAGNDTIITIDGTRGIKAGGGFDVIDGGAGYDVVKLGGVASDYQFLASGGMNYLVTSGHAVQLSNVEGIQFYNLTFSAVSETVAGVKEFDGLSYLAGYADLFTAFGTDATLGAAHFSSYGFSEGRSVTFNGLDYIASYQDLRIAFGADAAAGARHFIEWGAAEDRGTTFDGWTYLASYGDLISAYGADEGAAAKHYIQFGADEGRSATFDAAAYARDNADLVAAIGSDAQVLARHYVMYGYNEGRLTGTNANDDYFMIADQELGGWSSVSSHVDAFGFA